jgi:hypothetical protein
MDFRRGFSEITLQRGTRSRRLYNRALQLGRAAKKMYFDSL